MTRWARSLINQFLKRYDSPCSKRKRKSFSASRMRPLKNKTSFLASSSSSSPSAFSPFFPSVPGSKTCNNLFWWSSSFGTTVTHPVTGAMWRGRRKRKEGGGHVPQNKQSLSTTSPPDIKRKISLFHVLLSEKTPFVFEDNFSSSFLSWAQTKLPRWCFFFSASSTATHENLFAHFGGAFREQEKRERDKKF